jgi:hypothetical protein
MSTINLEDLKARALPICKWRDLLTVRDGELSPKEEEELDAYLKAFLPPNKDRKCVNCGLTLGGLVGRFTYGICHGEGYCSECGYPGRANHYNFGPIDSLTFILQYHPDGLELKEQEEG